MINKKKYAIKTINFENYLVRADDKIEHLTFFTKNLSTKTLVVISHDNRLIGTISDGDIRKYAERNFVNPILVSHAMNKRPTFLSWADLNREEFMADLNFTRGLYPIVDEKKFILGVCISSEGYEPKTKVWKKLTAIAPTRVSFGGGGSDVEDWFIENNGLVINAALAKYARVNFEEKDSSEISVHSLNSGEKWIVDKDNRADWPKNLIFDCLRQFDFKNGLIIKIFCDFDIGTGLGGSSSLCVALLKGLAELRSLRLTEKELMHLAYYTERKISAVRGGWQDQIAAVYGGILRIKFSSDDIQPIKIQLNEVVIDKINTCLFLVKVGGSRKSSEIHEKMKKSLEGDIQYKGRMNEIVELAKRAETILVNFQFDQIGHLLDKQWEIKSKLTESITNEAVTSLYNKLVSFGATGGKLLGAGGSGYFCVWVESDKQLQFLKQVKQSNLAAERVVIDLKGARVLYD